MQKTLFLQRPLTGICLPSTPANVCNVEKIMLVVERHTRIVIADANKPETCNISVTPVTNQ